MEISSSLLGAVLVVIACALALWRRRRIFLRTNESGIERFATFGEKVQARIGDGVAGFLATAFGVVGILLLAVEYQDSWGWIVLLPVLAIALFLVW